MSSIKPAALTHDEVIARLRGQTLHVPDLTSLWAHWPAPSTNKHYEPLRATVDEAIANISATRPSSQRRQHDDLALLTSLWYPQAAQHELEVLALYTVWLVCWDDEVDANEGDLAGDYAKAEAWRQETLHVTREALGLAVKGEVVMTPNSDPLHKVMRQVGREVQKVYSAEQRQHVYDKLALFVANCAVEQKLRLERVIPDYDSYMAMRTETVAGATLCSLIEFSRPNAGIAPVGLSATREKLDKQVSVLLSLLNDLLSLKKELRTECAINAVAALMTANGDLPSMVLDIIGKMQEAVASFDEAALELKENAKSSDEVAAAGNYIDGCRFIVTGTLEFTLKSPRYNLSRLLAQDGSLEIVL